MRSSWKRWLHVLGGSLGVLGIVFVALRLHAYSEEMNFSRFDGGDWLLVAFLSLTYGADNLLLAQAWRQLLLFLGIQVENRWAIKTYGLSQLAKYVPGNIFHLAGRQALGMAAGLPAGALAKSALWELGLIAVAGALFGLLALPLLWPALPVFIAMGMFAAMSVVAILALCKILASSVSMALLLQIAFLTVSGAVFIGILALVAPSSLSTSMLPALCGAYVVAWLAGLVTPGAPAGVGVRELVLLFLLKGVVTEADLLLAVVLGRVVTVFGDFSCFLSAVLIRGRAS